MKHTNEDDAELPRKQVHHDQLYRHKIGSCSRLSVDHLISKAFDNLKVKDVYLLNKFMIQ